VAVSNGAVSLAALSDVVKFIRGHFERGHYERVAITNVAVSNVAAPNVAISNVFKFTRGHFERGHFGRSQNENQQNHNQIIFEKLLECEKYIFNLKAKTQKLIFSKRKVGFLGFLICIYSLQQLYRELCENKKLLKFIPSYKMSQDHIELLFGCIRAHNGCNNNPTARQFVAIYKKILVNIMNFIQIIQVTAYLWKTFPYYT